MQENFLHFLWRWRRFRLDDLRTTSGEPLEIVHPGEPNTDAGPDFFAARLRLADQLWAGNVEIHVNSSDWLAHGHSSDRAYDNVILHVVFEEDRPIFRPGGDRLPTLELKGRIPEGIFQTWKMLAAERSAIPCRSRIAEVAQIVRLNWLDRLLTERLEQKTEAIEAALERTGGHWEQVFFEKTAWNFGLKINAEPFEVVAKSLTVNHLAKSRDNLLQIEALLFGQAGLLQTDFTDIHPRALKKEWEFLRHKYGLEPLDASAMKFLRLRPPNFPTVRLAQLAWLMHHSTHLFSKVLEAKTLRDVEHLFHAEVSDYWQCHYVFDKPSPRRRKTFGTDAVHGLVINTVAPFLFLYGKTSGRDDLRDRALRILEVLPPEANSVMDGWAEAGVAPRNGFESQALLQLSKRFCAEKRCLECGIGNFLLK